MCDEPSQLHCSTGYTERWSAVDGALASRGNHGNSNKIQQSEDQQPVGVLTALTSLGMTQAGLRYRVSANRTEPQSLALTRRVLALSQRLSSKGSDTKTCRSRSLESLRAQQRLRPVRLACGCRRGWARSTSDSSAQQARRGGRSPRTLGCLSLVGRAAPCIVPVDVIQWT